MLDKDKVVVIIPAFKAKNHIETVLNRLLNQGYNNILVVDDCCPDETYRVAVDYDVKVLNLEINKGVGGAFSAGLDYICNTDNFQEVMYIAKLDADDQHNPRCLETMHALIEDTDADFVKGDRYALGREPKNQPFIRKVGNIGLTFLTKLSTGYWHLNDPLNGQFIGDIRFLKMIATTHGFEHRYLFETGILVSASKIRAKVLDCPNLIKYADEESSMKVSVEIKNFAFYHFRMTAKRLWRDYFYPNFDIFCLSILLSFMLPIGVALGLFNYIYGLVFDAPTETGNIAITIILVLMGYISLIFFMLKDHYKYKVDQSVSRFHLPPSNL